MTSVSMLKLLRRKMHLPILMYHQIGESSDSALVVSANNFTAQMQWLKGEGYRPISLEETARRWESGRPAFHKEVVITFDDGFKNIYTLAYPILEKFGFTATVFLVADFIGGTNNWSENKEKLCSPLLGLEEIAAMPNLFYGSHTLSHRLLTKLPRSKAYEEIVSSRKKLEDRLGISIFSFCYPYGDYNEYLAEMVQQAGYLCACTTDRGNRHKINSRFFLKRIPVTEISLKRFRYRLSPLYDWEHVLNTTATL